MKKLVFSIVSVIGCLFAIEASATDFKRYLIAVEFGDHANISCPPSDEVRCAATLHFDPNGNMILVVRDPTDNTGKSYWRYIATTEDPSNLEGTLDVPHTMEIN